MTIPVVVNSTTVTEMYVLVEVALACSMVEGFMKATIDKMARLRMKEDSRTSSEWLLYTPRKTHAQQKEMQTCCQNEQTIGDWKHI